MKILHVDSSVTGAKSVSRPLSKATAERLLQLNPGAELVYRDLVNEPLRHYTAVIRMFGAEVPEGTPDQKHELAVGKEILEEFLSADVVVVGTPMYNFSIPSQLKAWIDLLCVPGTTFRYSSAGPEGLCGGKRVVIVSSRGGLYAESSNNTQADFQEKYLKTVFGFLGITDVSVVRAEGVAYGPEAAAKAVAGAQQQIAALQ
ncbi:MAG TPA: FMN-dependent NADH-azoreductase [Acidobacteriaceae bacterium]|jgi:FMN-dependent NADH-azoreductase|nr:FMN-dependent NADH-azoreductase [Acidobacteriaceae bacterium]